MKVTLPFGFKFQCFGRASDKFQSVIARQPSQTPPN